MAKPIVLEGVSKLYAPRPAQALRRFYSSGRLQPGEHLGVLGVSLHVEPGETFVLMGHSGSGKSTLLRLLNGLYRPTAGRVTVMGTDLGQLNRTQLVRLRRRVFCGMVFQGFALLPHRSALENVAFGLELQGVPRPVRLERAREALALVGLGERERALPAALSGGQQQRLGLARALVMDGDVLLMDEPFSALDPVTRRELQGELLRLRARVRKTIVFVTHDLSEALRLGDRIALLKEGRVQQIGRPEEIVAKPANAYVADFVAGADRQAVLRARSIMTPPEAVGGAALAGARTVAADAPLSEVARLAATGGVLSVVGDAGQPLGVITQRDVLLALAGGA
ncbi:ATP-binding cassette domain-containing protein [Truepera radiovictrix]|nr:ATP-binding cassette domain-containing protein [Truepera radiovictrix]WMT56594.1 ATP-binding cassette domain-containing protein [Truepera radiovictrix]